MVKKIKFQLNFERIPPFSTVCKMVGHTLRFCRKVQQQDVAPRNVLKRPNLHLAEDGPLMGFQGRETIGNVNTIPIIEAANDNDARASGILHDIEPSVRDDVVVSVPKDKGPLWGDIEESPKCVNNEVKNDHGSAEHWNIVVNSPVYEKAGGETDFKTSLARVMLGLSFDAIENTGVELN